MRETRTSGLMSGEGKRNASMTSRRIPRPSSTLLTRAVRQRRSAWVDCWRDPAAASVSPLNLVFELSGGDFGRGLYRGDHSPVGYGPAGINGAAMWRVEVGAGQAAAQRGPPSDAISMRRA